MVNLRTSSGEARNVDEQYEIEAGAYRATVTRLGGALQRLRHGQRDLVGAWDDAPVMPVYRGAVLAPWPNRIADGRYSYAGKVHQLPINEVERGTSLHGLVAFLDWQPRQHNARSISLNCRLCPQPGYPFPLDLDVTYTVSDAGLGWTLAATNAGSAPAPYGCSIHPYLVAGPGRVDDWTLTLPARRVLQVDPDRLLPQHIVHVDDGGPVDFRTGRRIGTASIDAAFTGLNWEAGQAAAQLRTADGSGVELRWSSACRWIQVHTADRPEPELHRAGLAMEPMTCPPDAFNSGVDLVHLRSQERYEVHGRIGALDGNV